MFTLLLTPPEFIPDEVQILEQLFEAGLTTLHVRKPNASLEQIEDFIRQFKPQYMKRLVLHSQYQLMAKYNIKGIHLTTHVWEELQEQGQLKEYIRPVQRRGLTVSASVHKFEEILKMPSKLDYAFLSPFFDSISKPGYKAAISPEVVEDFVFNNSKVPPIVALGGIEQNNIHSLKNKNIAGVALLGSVWQAPSPVEAFSEIQTALSS